MNETIIKKEYEKYYGHAPQEINKLIGGHRNIVFLCTDKSEEDVVIKVHRTNNYYNFFKNEITAYNLLENKDVRIPKLLFSDLENNLIGILKIDGLTVEESQNLDYYLPSLELLRDTNSKLKKIELVNSFFRRDISCFLDGSIMLNKYLGIDLNVSKEYEQIMYHSNLLDPCYNIGSFIPSNVIRGKMDNHIDLEMFSVGTQTEDLAYFTLFSGIHPEVIFDNYYVNDSSNKTSTLFNIFRSNLFKLGYLTLGLYSRELSNKDIKQSKKVVLNQRVKNILSTLIEIKDNNAEEIKGGFHGINM